MTTNQDEKSTEAVPEENIRTVKMGDTLIVNKRSKCDGANQYDWRDDGRKIIVISDTDYAFVNEDFITPEEINNNVNQALGKTVGEEFTLTAEGGDGDYTFTYTIVDILDIDVNDGYRQIMNDYMELYDIRIYDKDFDWEDMGDYNPEFYSASGEYNIPTFYIEDINGDGIQELFIALTDKEYYRTGIYEYEDPTWINIIYAGYTMQGEKPVSFTGAIGYRAGTCILCEDGWIKDCWSGSAFDNGFAWEYLPPNGTELITEEYINYSVDPTDENNVTYTYSKNEQEEEYSEEQYNELSNKYQLREIEFLSIQDYFGELYYR